MSHPRTAFEWAIYADATFAGLSTLIPIIGVDWLFEQIFRRRMPQSIAEYRNHKLLPFAKDHLNKSDAGCLKTLLMLPLILTIGLLKKLSRKILYFLTIKEAIDQINYYWHRAFLIDYMLSVGHLDNEESTRIARIAMDEVLEESVVSPLLQLAEQVVKRTRHIFRTLRGARKGTEDDVVAQKKSLMIERWGEFEAYFETIAARYDQAFQIISNRQVIEVTPQ